jgi:hypothetical protein
LEEAMKHGITPSYVALDAIIAAMILGLLAVGGQGGPYTGLLDVGIVGGGHVALALWVLANAGADEPSGDLRLVRRDGNVTIYAWTPPATGRQVNR